MKLDLTKVRKELIKKGVANLKEFGYPSCNVKNILTDGIYAQFFRSMLKDNLSVMGPEVDTVIKELLKETANVKIN